MLLLFFKTYPMDSECQCKIEAESEEAEVILSVLDMQMGASNECKVGHSSSTQSLNSWLTYTSNP